MFKTPFGSFSLQRLPFPGDPSHQGWDGADSLLLEWMEKEYRGKQGSFLVFNDAFGALSTALGHHSLVSVSDSFCSHQAQRTNRQNNGLDQSHFFQYDSLWKPLGDYDGVLIKIPRSLGLLEEQLFRIQNFLSPGTRIIGAAMVKNLPSGVFELFEKYFGELTTSLSDKKARLLFSRVSSHEAGKNPYPKAIQVEELGIILRNYGGVFSRDSLDPGSRFFLGHFPRQKGEKTIVDLGCGNGLLGIMAARLNPQAQVYLMDESYMAIASARESFHANGLFSQGVFHVANGLDGLDEGIADMVLCNPPFHFQNIQSREVSEKMFRDSYRVLSPGGALWVVGNNHLGYHKSLGEIFPQVSLVKKGPRFSVLRAEKPL